MISRNSLRLSATLLFIGEALIGVIARFVHPGGGPMEKYSPCWNCVQKRRHIADGLWLSIGAAGNPGTRDIPREPAF